MNDLRELDRFDWIFIRWDLARRDHWIIWIPRWIDTGQGPAMRIELPMRVGRRMSVK